MAGHVVRGAIVVSKRVRLFVIVIIGIITTTILNIIIVIFIAIIIASSSHNMILILIILVNSSGCVCSKHLQVCDHLALASANSAHEWRHAILTQHHAPTNGRT
jgi:hypothetical protein